MKKTKEVINNAIENAINEFETLDEVFLSVTTQFDKK